MPTDTTMQFNFQRDLKQRRLITIDREDMQAALEWILFLETLLSLATYSTNFLIARRVYYFLLAYPFAP